METPMTFVIVDQCLAAAAPFALPLERLAIMGFDFRDGRNRTLLGEAIGGPVLAGDRLWRDLRSANPKRLARVRELVQQAGLRQSHCQGDLQAILAFQEASGRRTFGQSHATAKAALYELAWWHVHHLRPLAEAMAEMPAGTSPGRGGVALHD
jgi:hypothetical protein